MPQPADDDFFSNEEIDINEKDSDADDDSGSDSSEASDFEQMRRVLHDPGPTAEVHELRKALAIAQKAYSEARVELRSVRKELHTLSSAIPTRKRNRVLNKSSESLSVDASITKEAKKYALLYNFWVPDGLFPPTPKPNVDPHSPTRWASPRDKLDGAMAELYSVVPSSLHKHMENYKQFGSIFTSALGQERSNILRAIKDCASIVFASYGLDPTGLSGHPSGRKDDAKFQALLKRDGVGEYTRLAPILFKNHENMVANEFLMSPAITSIIRALIHGKASLSDHKRGRPKARGQRIGINSATSGLISGAATLARFLVSPDQELSAIGAETRIPYSSDYDFYVEKLSKRSNWALRVFDHVNREVFAKDSQSKNVPLVAPAPPTQPRTWEDDMLSEIENPVSNSVSASPFNGLSDPVSSNPQSASSLRNINTANDSSSPSSVSVSAMSQLQLEVGQLSVGGSSATIPLSSTSSQSSTAPTSRRRLIPVPVQGQGSMHAAAEDGTAHLPEPPKRTMRTRTGKTSKAKK
ncbi:hypothetical protein EDD15DRAFT_2367425 [Pisolithus albus]|nr:hypothetical protein EDD15DRAFT_2367425 [Pisolithus albus]